MAGKDRPEGCVLRDSYLEESPEVPSVSLERHTSRVCVPFLWSGGCSEAFHRGYEAGCCSSSARRYPSDHLLGRSAVHESIAGGPGAGYGNCALLAREFRVCCQFRKVMLRSNPADGISRVSSQQSGYDSAPSRLQSGGNKSPLSLPASTSKRICPGRELSQLIGKLTSSIQAIFPAPLHYRSLQHLKHQALAQGKGFDATIALSSEAREELHWWSAHLDAWNGRELLHSPPDLVMETDASRKGWGSVCQGVKTEGLWSQMERTLHINCLELLAGSFAVKCFAKGRLCAHVRLRMDNTSAVAYVNRLGGTRSLVLPSLALALWEWALSQNIFLSAEHLAGRMNVMADCRSRHFTDSSNWWLCPEVFQALMQIRGPCAKDLFADRLNIQLPRF